MAGPGDYFGSYGKAASSIAQGADDIWSLFRGKTEDKSNTRTLDLTTVNQEEVDPAKAKALIDQILSGTSGLAAVSSGQRSNGLYGSTTNQQLTNDLLARSTADIAALGKKTTQTQSGTIGDFSSDHKKGAMEWIICTELHKQGRMPHKFYRYGARVFANYSERGKQGYYIWAIPAVKHLRKHPDSLRSKLMEKVFVARAEYLAAQAGCKEARKTVLGFLTTHILYGVCVIFSRTIARKPIDWYSSVYNEGIGGA